MVTGTLGAPLRSSAAVSSVNTCVWVSIVRTLLISPPERRRTSRGKERLSAAAGALTQAPVVILPLSYKRDPQAHFRTSHDSKPRPHEAHAARRRRYPGARRRPLHG